MAMRTVGEMVEDGTRGMSKTEAIRAALKKDPGVMPKALAERLTAMGFDVKPQHVSTIKNVLKREAEGTLPVPRGRRGRRPAAERLASPAAASPVAASPAAASPAAASPAAPEDISFESLRKAKELSAELGGIEKAKEALDALVQLTG